MDGSDRHLICKFLFLPSLPLVRLAAKSFALGVYVPCMTLEQLGLLYCGVTQNHRALLKGKIRSVIRWSGFWRRCGIPAAVCWVVERGAGIGQTSGRTRSMACEQVNKRSTWLTIAKGLVVVLVGKLLGTPPIILDPWNARDGIGLLAVGRHSLLAPTR